MGDDVRFWVDVGGGPHPIDADDADEAAENAAERDFNNSGEPLNEYDVTVLAPDGEVTKHTVTVEHSPSFSADTDNDEPHPAIVAYLRARAARDAR